MDFGVGFLSNNVMLPILDFFYGILPSYGLAIIFLTLVIRFALYPLNVGSIRNMRKMRVIQPLMQKRTQELQQRYANDPAKLKEEQAKVYGELGVNPLGGCLPLIVQMPVLFALFATLRGSPFTNVPFDINLQILPREVAAEVAPEPFSTAPKNIFLTDTVHKALLVTAPGGTKVGVGDKVKLALQGAEGKAFDQLGAEVSADMSRLKPTWTLTKGQDRAQIQADGSVIALEPGDVTVQVTIPGLAAETGFLFIDKLGQVGAIDPDGTIHWDVIAMILVFGVSIYLNQAISGQGATDNSQNNPATKLTPILFSGMFLFFPLPAGVLLYILISNVFQTAQTYILSREALPPDLAALVEEEKLAAANSPEKGKTDKGERESLPFEP